MEEIKIPEGTKSMTCNIEDNKVILEFIPKKEFKDGDIIFGSDGLVKNIIAIYNSVNGNGAILYYFSVFGSGGISRNKVPDVGIGYASNYRLATEEEKQKLFGAMAGDGLKWNAEKKQIEKIRWRAEHGKYYYWIGSNGKIMRDAEIECERDNIRYQYGNYFKTEEEAKQKSEQIKKLLKGE